MRDLLCAVLVLAVALAPIAALPGPPARLPGVGESVP